jgi:hypothetical protein
MYYDFWLASARDSLYKGSGTPLFRSPAGTAGRHVGRETDLFLTWTRGPVQWGVGGGYFFAGEFLQRSRHDFSPVYAYTFAAYGF